MGSNLQESDAHEVLETHHVRYEVRPYYVILDQRLAGAPPQQQKVQAGFDVDLYGVLEKEHLPLFHSEGAQKIVKYFEQVARQIELRVGNKCAIELMPYADLVVLDTHQHLQPQVMLRIRISHARGLDQPKGPAEEQALTAIQETLRQLSVRQV
jgi:hypothetical protein